MFPFYGWVQLSQGYSHFEEAVYFLPLSKNWGGEGWRQHSFNASLAVIFVIKTQKSFLKS